MRRAYRRPYSIPADIKQRTTQGDSSKSLVQPAWDVSFLWLAPGAQPAKQHNINNPLLSPTPPTQDTIHDLKAYRASPEDVVSACNSTLLFCSQALTASGWQTLTNKLSCAAAAPQAGQDIPQPNGHGLVVTEPLISTQW